jgi:hypothetical protein
VLEAELVGGEVLREPLQQLRVARRVGRPEVVVRIDQPAAHQVQPHAVHLRPGEERVVGRRDPVRHRPEPVAAGEVGRRRAQELRLRRLFGAPADHLAGAVLPHHLLADELVLVEPVPLVVLQHPVVDPGEQRPEAVVVVHRPAVERVVVAPGAAHPHAEEHLRDRLRPGQRVADRRQKFAGGFA